MSSTNATKFYHKQEENSKYIFNNNIVVSIQLYIYSKQSGDSIKKISGVEGKI